MILFVYLLFSLILFAYLLFSLILFVYLLFLLILFAYFHWYYLFIYYFHWYYLFIYYCHWYQCYFIHISIYIICLFIIIYNLILSIPPSQIRQIQLIRRAAVWETAVSRHHGGHKWPFKPLEHCRRIYYERFKGGLQLGPYYDIYLPQKKYLPHLRHLPPSTREYASVAMYGGLK